MSRPIGGIKLIGRFEDHNDEIVIRDVKSKFFFVQNLPVEVTKDELRKFFEYRGVRISAIEICHYQLYDELERVYALVEIRDIDQSKEFYTMFNNSTLAYYTNNNHFYSGTPQQNMSSNQMQ